ncbi:spirocyclase AveC family protein [Nocardia harenae]|uniref:spirocyclase AveC family protein n=1 Tax=Nocardia harenae TaxID=358707 RepID=UPI00082D9F50|nr:spirocyclase AveC family protein [Nocardia harenae]
MADVKVQSSEALAPPPPRPVRPVVVWSVAGAGALVLQFYVFASWLSTDAAPVIATGVPRSTWVFVIVFQVAMTSAAVFALCYVGRGVIRERRVTIEAALLIGYASCFWQDPITPNYLRVTFYYSSAFVNQGSWGHHIPGWISPNSSVWVEPFFLTGSSYLAMILTAIQGRNAMRWIKRRRPQTNVAGLLFTGWLVVASTDFLLENLFVRTGVYAFPGTIHGLSISGGTIHQVPVYESMTWGLVWATGAAILYFVDDRGQSFVEKGIDSFPLGLRHRGLFKILSCVGVLNLAYIFCFAIPYNLISLHIDPFPEGYPSHLNNGICGVGTPYACPDPGLPMNLPNAPVPPPP